MNLSAYHISRMQSMEPRITLSDDEILPDYGSIPYKQNVSYVDEKEDEVKLTFEQKLLVEQARPCSKCCHRNYSTGQNGDTTCIYCNEEHRCFSL